LKQKNNGSLRPIFIVYESCEIKRARRWRISLPENQEGAEALEQDFLVAWRRWPSSQWNQLAARGLPGGSLRDDWVHFERKTWFNSWKVWSGLDTAHERMWSRLAWSNHDYVRARPGTIRLQMRKRYAFTCSDFWEMTFINCKSYPFNRQITNQHWGQLWCHTIIPCGVYWQYGCRKIFALSWSRPDGQLEGITFAYLCGKGIRRDCWVFTKKFTTISAHSRLGG